MAQPACHSKPRQVHKQHCQDVPVHNCPAHCSGLHKCHKVPKKIARQVAHRVPSKHCERLNTNLGSQGYRLVGVFNGDGGGGVHYSGGGGGGSLHYGGGGGLANQGGLVGQGYGGYN